MPEKSSGREKNGEPGQDFCVVVKDDTFWRVLVIQTLHRQ